MKINSDTIIRIIRGTVGATMVIVGILYENWIAFPGFLLFFSGLSGGCGFGNTSCKINDHPETGREKNE